MQIFLWFYSVLQAIESKKLLWKFKSWKSSLHVGTCHNHNTNYEMHGNQNIGRVSFEILALSTRMNNKYELSKNWGFLFFLFGYNSSFACSRLGSSEALFQESEVTFKTGEESSLQCHYFTFFTVEHMITSIWIHRLS